HRLRCFVTDYIYTQPPPGLQVRWVSCFSDISALCL
nr:hypothetical protein [Tanacetum cinerariifolium]